MRPLTDNTKGIADLLKLGVYKDAALMPTMSWLDGETPRAPINLKVQWLTATEVNDARPKRLIKKPEGTPPTTRRFMPLRVKDDPKEMVGGYRIAWEPRKPTKEIRSWTVYAKYGDKWTMRVIGGPHTQAIVRAQQGGKPVTDVAVAAVGKLGEESPRAMLRIPPPGAP
jgi:hypothetical protein